MSVRSLASALAVALAAGGCGQAGLSFPHDGGGDGGPDPSSCGPGIDAPAFEGRTHVPVGSTVSYVANPPASGNHYPVWWMPWGLATQVVQREYWVHNLEHGGIVLLYNCPAGCPDVVSQLVALRNGTKPDQYNEQRLIITADPRMPRKVAAVAWGYRWQGDAVDAATVDCFIKARYDRGLESVP